MLDKDRITIIWNEYKEHNDWQRHNETQRAQLTSVLLAISAALVALFPKDRPLTMENWPIPCFLMGIGVFGMLAVLKYWERFCYHVKIESAYRDVLDSFFMDVNDQSVGRGFGSTVTGQTGIFVQTRNRGLAEHSSWLKKLPQHWLWIVIFAFVGGLGFMLFVQLLKA